jgi:hypothetical protein
VRLLNATLFRVLHERANNSSTHSLFAISVAKFDFTGVLKVPLHRASVLPGFGHHKTVGQLRLKLIDSTLVSLYAHTLIDNAIVPLYANTKFNNLFCNVRFNSWQHI